MNEIYSRTLIRAVIGGAFLICACILFACLGIAMAMTSDKDIDAFGGSIGLVAFLNMAMFYVFGMGLLKQAMREVKEP